ncbi:MAG: DNA gyrase subunit A, partial [Solirubrobacteraceae bacterium]|nr:DNA gyrase subunit A [Solirubrobacteraceae bacterium]
MTASQTLPDVRDGLTSLQRVALRAVASAGPTLTRSSRIVANAASRKPHFERPDLYGAIVSQATAWTLRYPLVEGSGDFGSADGDEPAAAPFTEVRVGTVATALLSELDDPAPEGIIPLDRRASSIILPGPFPHLLANGARTGTSLFPPHNLTEVCAAIVARIDDPTIDVVGLLAHLTGPDFPSGGTIVDDGSLRTIYETGKGTLRVRDEDGEERSVQVSMTGTLEGEERTFTLVELIDEYVAHRREVIVRRDQQERRAAELDADDEAAPRALLTESAVTG